MDAPSSQAYSLSEKRPIMSVRVAATSKILKVVSSNYSNKRFENAFILGNFLEFFPKLYIFN